MSYLYSTYEARVFVVVVVVVFALRSVPNRQCRCVTSYSRTSPASHGRDLDPKKSAKNEREKINEYQFDLTCKSPIIKRGTLGAIRSLVHIRPD